MQAPNLVIISVEPQSVVSSKERVITSLEIDTRDFNFDRDEANER
jgi:hypothetical protein